MNGTEQAAAVPRQDGDFAIDVKGITKQFGGKTVVNRVDLQVKYGEIYGFLGPNGSGKTTFIRMLCGLLTPDGGEGCCLGYDVLTEQRRIKKEIGYMTQHFSFYNDLTVRENLDFVAKLYRIRDRKARVDSMLEKLHLAGRQKQLAGTLSGGWKQQLALAASLIHQPRLLLLDEPTAGVDPKTRRDFWDRIHELAGQGMTVLITTHYMDEAERCHRLAYLAYGDLLTRGTLDYIIRNAGLKTWTVTGDNLFELAGELRHTPAVEQVVAFGNILHVSGADPATLDRAVAPFRRDPYQWREIPSGLEDVFIHLMRNREDNFQK